MFRGLSIVTLMFMLSACQTTTGPIGAGDGTVVRSITFETGVDYPEAGTKRTGQLILPKSGATKLPAVIMVHGTAGPDSRYYYHTGILNEAGYAVFQMDFKSGIFSGPRDRIGIRPFMPMAAAALKTLRQQPEIDPDRIAIMGFSFGGALSREVFHRNFRAYQMRGKDGFAAHVAFYPQCRFSMGIYQNMSAEQSFAGGKMLVITGENDSYGDGMHCPKLKKEIDGIKEGQMELLVIPGVDHGFDGTRMVMGFSDPVAINGTANMIPSPRARDLATKEYLKFLAANM